MSLRKMFFVGVVLAATVAFSGFSAADDDIADDVRRACRSCHSLKPVCQELGVRSLAGWKLVVRNMVARGARLTTRNIEPAAEYLATLEPGDPAICE